MSKLILPNGEIFFSQEVLYPGCHQINRDIAYENLKDIAMVMPSGIKWGVAFGTLLGIVRENDFIEWDEDVDLYILEEDEELFKSILPAIIKRGFSIIRYERGGLYSVRRNGEYIDFYVLKKVSEDVRYTVDGCFILEKFLRKQTIIHFKEIDLSIPEDIDEYLSFEYGNWKSPVRYYSPHISFLRKIYLKLYYYFRIYSPTVLYNWWIRKRRNNDLKAFIKKCLIKGYELPQDLKIV